MGAAAGVWRRPPAETPLAEEAVHAWRASLDVPFDLQRRLEEVLSPDEVAAAARFRAPESRRRHAAAHGVLRLVLARYLAADPRSLRFVRRCAVCGGPHGKPALAVPRSEGLSFNLSHSGSIALVAVARRRPVGVDCEQLRPDVAHREIAARFFTPREVAQLDGLPEAAGRDAFFACWVRKEAYVKARGEGLSLSLDAFDVSSVDGGRGHVIARDGREVTPGWQVLDLAPAPGYVGAVAAEGAGWALEAWDAVP